MRAAGPVHSRRYCFEEFIFSVTLNNDSYHLSIQKNNVLSILPFSSLFCDSPPPLASCDTVVPVAILILIFASRNQPPLKTHLLPEMGELNYVAVTTLSSTGVKFLVLTPTVPGRVDQESLLDAGETRGYSCCCLDLEGRWSPESESPACVRGMPLALAL